VDDQFSLIWINCHSPARSSWKQTVRPNGLHRQPSAGSPNIYVARSKAAFQETSDGHRLISINGRRQWSRYVMRASGGRID
jgi:hypothetical protein